jgi:flagellar motor switch protein FliN/FliY
MTDQKQLNAILADGWTAAFNALLGREARVTVQSVRKKEKKDLAAVLKGCQAFVRLSYGGGNSDNIVMAMQNRLVSIISSLTTGLDTFKDDITADDRDTLEEAVKQMFAACQTPLKKTLGLDMEFKNVSFVEAAGVSALLGGGAFKAWHCAVDLQEVDTQKFILITPQRFGVVETPGKEAGEKTAAKPDAAGAASHAGQGTPGSSLDLLAGIELPVTIRIGSAEKRLGDLLKMGPGSVIQLDKAPDDPVDILVNGKLVAQGEIVASGGGFAVRVTEVRSTADRIHSLA